jgi:hypothetical protein
MKVLGAGCDNQPCLHCQLSEVVDRFLQQHSGKCLRQAVGEISQVIGELVASGLHNARQRARLDAELAFSAAVMLKGATDLFEALDRGEHLDG